MEQNLGLKITKQKYCSFDYKNKKIKESIYALFLFLGRTIYAFDVPCIVYPQTVPYYIKATKRTEIS